MPAPREVPPTVDEATRDSLPAERPSRVVVSVVRPIVDGGHYPAKVALGRPARIVADVFTNGHDVSAALVRWRRTGTDTWHEAPMASVGFDRFEALVDLGSLGRWEFEVLGWVDEFETWRRDTASKVAAGLDVSVDLLDGARMLRALTDHHPRPGTGRAADPSLADDLARLDRFVTSLEAGDPDDLDDHSWAEVGHRRLRHHPVTRTPQRYGIVVDPDRATFSSWYEFFPRSRWTHGLDADDAASEDEAPLVAAIGRLDRVAAMGFDVLYIPPVHPIGRTNRKGANNSVIAEPDSVGSPWAIGAKEGGHTAVAPELGTVADLERLAQACRERGMELAMDIAFQCSPDHPWVTEHPEWFRSRSDGTIRCAENPPKIYEDIYPLDFDGEHWRALWTALEEVIRFWIDRGVHTFRVDNPHTKAFPFWQWVIGSITADHPDTVFLAEAFTRPRVMEHLAKIGFNQSYTYFAWSQSSWELRRYFGELATDSVDYFRPNAWPNTPDILTEQLQTDGRPAFVTRAILAATLSPSWGIYGPAYELMERVPVREGSEEYLDSEKFQVRSWDLSRPDSLEPLVTRLNAIRRSNPALQNLETLRFHGTEDPGLLCFSKVDLHGDGLPVLVVVNLDPHRRIAAHVDVDLAALNLPYESEYDVTDQLGGATYRWSGNHNYVDLAPHTLSAHIFTVRGVA